MERADLDYLKGNCETISKLMAQVDVSIGKGNTIVATTLTSAVAMLADASVLFIERKCEGG